MIGVAVRGGLAGAGSLLEKEVFHPLAVGCGG